MDSAIHTDPVVREKTIAAYLARTMSASAQEDFETHILACDNCYEEVRATELLMWGLRRPAVETVRNGEVTVIRFATDARLVSRSSDLDALAQAVHQSDTKVLIDLGRVSRIDSTGLGTLMQCYTHAVRNSGALKLLQPPPQVKKVLALTKIDSVLPTFEDEALALRSFTAGI